jgi:hypothetical protein
VSPFDDDHASISWPPAPAPSRRTILAAGALGIAGAALAAGPASAAIAVGGVPERMAKSAKRLDLAGTKRMGFAGANRSAFATMLSGRPHTPPTGVRWYMDDTHYPNTTGYASASWPDITTEYHSRAHALVSIRPDIEMLVDGKFDAGLYAFMRGAPAGPASLLTIWHECATFTLHDPRYPKNPALYRQGLSHLQALAAGKIHPYSEPTDVKVGVIDINPGYLKDYPHHKNDPKAVYAEWMAANLDWYGCDLYDNKTLDLSVYEELNTFREYINSLPESEKNADWPINLPECNSRYPKKGVSTVRTSGPTRFRRSDFFHYAWSWLQDIGPGGPCSGLLGFWGGTGGEGAPWPPVNNPKGSLEAMIAELNAENSHSAP